MAAVEYPIETITPPTYLSKGCYLTFELASEGTLFAQWSETPVPEALAYFSPSKPVADFKYKANGGKAEIIRGFKGATRNRYYDGYCQFAKLCREYNGELCLLTPSVKLYSFLPEGDVVEICPGACTSLKESHAVGVVMKDKACFDGVGKLTRSYFLGTAKKEGGGLSFVG